MFKKIIGLSSKRRVDELDCQSAAEGLLLLKFQKFNNGCGQVLNISTLDIDNVTYIKFDNNNIVISKVSYDAILKSNYKGLLTTLIDLQSLESFSQLRNKTKSDLNQYINENTLNGSVFEDWIYELNNKPIQYKLIGVQKTPQSRLYYMCLFQSSVHKKNQLWELHCDYKSAPRNGIYFWSTSYLNHYFDNISSLEGLEFLRYK